MGFSGFEGAIVSEPIELIFFARDDDYWAYTTHDQDITRNTILYRAGLVTRSAFEQGEELNQVTVNVQISTDTELGQQLRNEGMSGDRGIIFMRLMLTHANDPGTISPFFGQVVSLSRHGAYVEVTVDSAMSIMKRKLLRYTGGVQCGHALYDSSCGVNMNNFKIDATVVAISGRIVAAGSSTDPTNTLQSPEWYAGGILQFGKERYFIEHNDNVGNLTMEGQIPSYILGQPVVLYAGCDRAFYTCDAKFNNARNFGGFPNFPVNNPFGSTQRPN